MLALAAAWLLLGADPSAAEKSIPPSLIAAGVCRKPQSKPCQAAVELYESQSKALAWIVVDHAEANADEAIAKGDVRLFGVYGYSVYVPDAADADFLPNGCGLKMIEGTSDHVADLDFIERPAAYAERYNRRILKRTGCWTKPPTRIGVGWRVSRQPAPELWFGAKEGFYFLDLRCRDRDIEVSQVRLARQQRPNRLRVVSDALAEDAKTRFEPPDRSLKRHDFFYLNITLSKSAAVLDAFARTGRLSFDGQSLNAETEEERADIRGFLAACATFKSPPP